MLYTTYKNDLECVDPLTQFSSLALNELSAPPHHNLPPGFTYQCWSQGPSLIVVKEGRLEFVSMEKKTLLTKLQEPLGEYWCNLVSLGTKYLVVGLMDSFVGEDKELCIRCIEVPPNPRQKHISIQGRKLMCTGAIPKSRNQPSLVMFDGSLLMFGGKSETGFENDVRKFDVEKNHWSVVSTWGETPSPRCGATAVKYKDWLMIVGGEDECGLLKENYVYILKVKTGMWIKVEMKNPLSRRYQSVGVVGNKTVLVIGGQSVDGGELNDVIEIELREVKLFAVLKKHKFVDVHLNFVYL